MCACINEYIYIYICVCVCVCAWVCGCVRARERERERARARKTERVRVCVRVRVRERKKETEVHINLNHASGQLVIKYLAGFCGSLEQDIRLSAPGAWAIPLTESFGVDGDKTEGRKQGVEELLHNVLQGMTCKSEMR